MSRTVLSLCLLLFAIPLFAAADGIYYRQHDGSWRLAEPGMFPRASAKASTHLKKADLSVTITYEDMTNASGFGFDDPVLGADRRATLEAVLGYIASILDHNGGLEVSVTASLNVGGTNPVASAGPLVNLTNGYSEGLPLLHITTGNDPTGDFPDMNLTVDFGHSMTSTTAAPGPNEIDLYSVLLHELTHGLGFVTFSDENGGSLGAGNGFNTYTLYDSNIFSGNGTQMWDDQGNMTGTAAMLRGQDGGLVFRGSATMEALGRAPLLYAPDPYESGSSVGHWHPEVGDAVMLSVVSEGIQRRTYRNFEIAALEDIGYTVNYNRRLVFPWVSNSNDFSSTLVINNPSNREATIDLTARRGDGSSQSAQVTIPARGFLQQAAGSIFDQLGVGPGYTVSLSANVPGITGRWVTNDNASQTPSQGVAINISDGNGQRLGETIMLGFLPGNLDFQSAPVITNVSDSAVDVTVYFYDQNGTQVNAVPITGLQPMVPQVVSVVGADAGDQYAVARSDSGSITGVIFVFNSLNQTAIGNATALPGFTP